MDFNIEKAKQGDKEAFTILIEENKLVLFKIAKRILEEEEDIKDALQETILKAYSSIEKLKRNEYFKTWLIRILINECRILIKQKNRIFYLDELVDNTVYEDKPIDDSVSGAISLLEEDLKLIVNLYYYEDIPTKEIAKILQIPEGTVKSRLSRARNKLSKALKESGYIYE